MTDLINIEAEIEKLTERLDQLNVLNEVQDDLSARSKTFAADLIGNYLTRGSLTDRQWYWVDQLIKQVKGIEPIYGSFNAVLVMFRMAAAGSNAKGHKLKAIKTPKVRLMTDEGRYVQLNFNPEKTSEVDVYVDGWQGHGYRKFAGKLKEDRILPYRDDRMTDDVKATLQEFSLDPERVAKAMAAKLGVCVFCGSRLSDDRSKHVGYGPDCATRYGLPWGEANPAGTLKKIA